MTVSQIFVLLQGSGVLCGVLCFAVCCALRCAVLCGVLCFAVCCALQCVLNRNQEPPFFLVQLICFTLLILCFLPLKLMLVLISHVQGFAVGTHALVGIMAGFLPLGKTSSQMVNKILKEESERKFMAVNFRSTVEGDAEELSVTMIVPWRDSYASNLSPQKPDEICSL